MRELDNTVWEDTSYSTLTGTSKKDYKSACVKDYNCDVIESAPIAERDSPHLPKENRKELEHPILFTIVTVAAFALAISSILIHRNRVWAYTMISVNGNCELIDDFGLKEFTYAELEAMTNGFTDEVGRGSFGTVYKGTIRNNQ
ncbi:hypothetical protein LguiB_032509 [Lonicera macranthoides]